jgi:hypothetical protein
MTKKSIPELKKLEELEPDPTILYILDLFYSLVKGPDSPISYSELKCYCELMQIELEPEEIEAIFKIERVYRRG